MEIVLSRLQRTELFVYSDDIVLYDITLQEHKEKFDELMKRFGKSYLHLQPDKCEFLEPQIAYVGHIIAKYGVRLDHRKMKWIKQFPRPKNKKKIVHFLGLAGYYRRFIKDV